MQDNSEELAKTESIQSDDSDKPVEKSYNPTQVKKQNSLLYWGAIVLGLLTAVSVFFFAQSNHSEVKNMSDTFLVEIATGLSDKIALLVDDSKQSIQQAAEHISLLASDQDMISQSLSISKNNTNFDDIFISYDGEPAYNYIGETLDVDMSSLYGQLAKDEVTVFSPIEINSTGVEYLLFGTAVYDGTEKIAELYGVYHLESFSDVLALKSFGGEAFYHLCEIDGTPLYLSGSNDNLFQGGDMYTFIGSLDIYNGHTTDSIRQDMEDGNTVLLNYYINSQERSAVMVAIPGTEWCVVSIVLSDVNDIMLERISRGTLIFAAFLIFIYVAYFITNLLFARQTRTALIESLESSRKLTSSLRTSIETDSLTGTYSRATITDKISSIISNARRPFDVHALVILDVDNFKIINDTYGHQTGDIYLQKFAAAIRAGLRTGDILGRIGGDEFMLLLGNIQTAKAAEKVMERILINVNNISIEGVSLDNVSVSAGVVMVDDDRYMFKDLSNMADTALYKAKRAGKDKFEFYSN